MQITSTTPLHNHNVPVIATTKNFTFCPGKEGKTFQNFFQQNSRTSQDSKKKNPRLSRMWQPCRLMHFFIEVIMLRI